MISEDKILHFIAGFIIAFISNFFIKHTYAISLSGIAGIGKETYDYYHPANHTVEMNDFLATLFGGICGAIVSNIFKRLFFYFKKK